MVVYWMTASFFIGWVLFPIFFTLGPAASGKVGEDAVFFGYFFGDLFSKNIFVQLCVYVKVNSSSFEND